jgi:hypothetical protein
MCYRNQHNTSWVTTLNQEPPESSHLNCGLAERLGIVMGGRNPNEARPEPYTGIQASMVYQLCDGAEFLTYPQEGGVWEDRNNCINLTFHSNV